MKTQKYGNTNSTNELKPSNQDSELLKPKLLPKGHLVGYIIDMLNMPDQIELNHVYNGDEGLRHDAANIRGYFYKAQQNLFPKY